MTSPRTLLEALIQELRGCNVSRITRRHHPAASREDRDGTRGLRAEGLRQYSTCCSP